MGLWHERRGGANFGSNVSAKAASKIRTRHIQRSTRNLMMACESWRRSLWFERIGASRRPRFEPDIENVPHEI